MPTTDATAHLSPRLVIHHRHLAALDACLAVLHRRGALLGTSLMPVDGGRMPFDARDLALAADLMTLGPHLVTLGACLVARRADLMTVGAGLMPHRRGAMTLESLLMTLCGRLAAGHAVLLDVLARSRALDPRLRAVAAMLPVPALAGGGRRGEQCEAQQKRSVVAFHGAPPRRPRGVCQRVMAEGRGARPRHLFSKARTT
ncbi:MAG TPA: hypothetical protein VFS60_08030 [Thermoanaerobaculia bacterium]|nr:hypothetical protein [Thermoanaerobaculia bacterium]